MSTNDAAGVESTGTRRRTEPTITGPQLATDRYGAPDHYYYECHDCGEEWPAEYGRDAHDCTEYSA